MSDYERTIGFADMWGTRAEVSCLFDDDGEDPSIHVTLVVGAFRASGIPTLEAARQLAAALLDAIDHAEKVAG